MDALLAQLGVSVLALDVQKADAVFLAVCSTLVFMAQVGFALLEVGSVSVKNTKGILVKNVMDLCASSVAFYAIGYGLALGKSSTGGAFGTAGFALRTAELTSLENTGTVVTAFTRAFFAMCFSATSATIVSGAVAERCSFKAYFMCAAAHLGRRVSRRFALAVGGERVVGAGARKRSGAVRHRLRSITREVDSCTSSAVCARSLDDVHHRPPREGRFTEGQRAPNAMPQQSPVFQVIGGLIMWYGWYGFTCGSIKTLAGPHLASLCPRRSDSHHRRRRRRHRHHVRGLVG